MGHFKKYKFNEAKKEGGKKTKTKLATLFFTTGPVKFGPFGPKFALSRPDSYLTDTRIQFSRNLSFGLHFFAHRTPPFFISESFLLVIY